MYGLLRRLFSRGGAGGKGTLPAPVPTFSQYVVAEIPGYVEALHFAFQNNVITPVQVETLLTLEANRLGLTQEYFEKYHRETVDSLEKLVVSGSISVDYARSVLGWRSRNCANDGPGN